MTPTPQGSPMMPADFLRHKATDPETLAYLWLALDNRRSVMVCGGSCSGKTTTLNLLSLFVPPDARVERVEAAAGQDRYESMLAAIQRKPEYLLVREVQGKEAQLAFQAMSEGLGVCTAIEFPDVGSMVHGLEAPPVNMPRTLFTDLDVLVLQNQVGAGDSRRRRITNVVEMVGYEKD